MGRRVIVGAWVLPGVFRYGGMSTFVEELERVMVSRGYRVVHVGCAPTPFYGCEFDGGLGIWRCNVPCGDPNPRGLERVAGDIIKLCEGVTVDADWVLLNDYHVAPCAVVSALNAPTVFFMHAYAASPLEGLALGYSHIAVTNSRLMRRVVEPARRGALSLFGWWVEKVLGRTPDSKVHVVYPAPPRKPERVKRVEREELPVKTRYLVVFVGRYDPVKGLDVAVEAVKILRSRGVDIGLVAAGHGLEKGWLEKPFAYCLGAISEEEKWGLYEVADAGIFPSKFEPFGLVPLEMIQAGLPVAVSEKAGVTEVLEAPTFNPESPEDAANKLLYILRKRDTVLEDEKASPIFDRKWEYVLDELEAFVEKITASQ